MFCGNTTIYGTQFIRMFGRYEAVGLLTFMCYIGENIKSWCTEYTCIVVNCLFLKFFLLTIQSGVCSAIYYPCLKLLRLVVK